MHKVSKFKTAMLWFGRILLGSSAVCLVVGTGFAIETVTFVLRAKNATATVVRLDEQASDNGVNYAPVFAFTAADGRQYTVRSRVATDPPGFEVGESANILYVPTNPSGARIASFWQLWTVSVILGFIAVAHGLLGGCLTHFARPKKSSQSVTV